MQPDREKELLLCQPPESMVADELGATFASHPGMNDRHKSTQRLKISTDVLCHVCHFFLLFVEEVSAKHMQGNSNVTLQTCSYVRQANAIQVREVHAAGFVTVRGHFDTIAWRVVLQTFATSQLVQQCEMVHHEYTMGLCSNHIVNRLDSPCKFAFCEMNGRCMMQGDLSRRFSFGRDLDARVLSRHDTTPTKAAD